VVVAVRIQIVYKTEEVVVLAVVVVLIQQLLRLVLLALATLQAQPHLKEIIQELVL
jgi:hypothetical protein